MDARRNESCGLCRTGDMAGMRDELRLWGGPESVSTRQLLEMYNLLLGYKSHTVTFGLIGSLSILYMCVMNYD